MFTCAEAGAPAFFVARAVAHTLAERNLLLAVVSPRPGPEWVHWRWRAVQEGEAAPPLAIGSTLFTVLTPAEVPAIYRLCGGTEARQPATLNAWIRAAVPGARGVFELVAQCASGAWLANLVERGGDLLQALREETASVTPASGDSPASLD